MDDFTDQIWADNGWPQGNVPESPDFWDETEILGDKALVKVRAETTTLATISGTVGFFTIPTRYVLLADNLSDMTAGERNQIQNAILSLGYTQGEIDAAMGNSLTLWRTKTLDDLLSIIASRRLKPRYNQPTDTIVCDGPVQPVKSHRSVAAKVV
jgi:hypothetical protein